MAIPRTQRGGWPYHSQPPNVPFTVNRAAPQAKGLVAWWPMLGSQGTINPIRDMADGRFPMTQFNTPTWVADSERGWSVLFDDALSEYLENANAIVTSTPFTFTCWFNSDTTAGAQTLVGIGSIFNTNFWLMGLLGGDVWFRANDGANSDAFSTGAYNINEWTHAAVVAATATDRRVFRDGANKGTNVVNRIPADVVQTRISRFPGTASQWFLSGRVADARIYNRALSDAEVWQQFINPWELYQPQVQQLITTVAITGLPIPVAMHSYRTRRTGNMAN